MSSNNHQLSVFLQPCPVGVVDLAPPVGVVNLASPVGVVNLTPPVGVGLPPLFVGCILCCRSVRHLCVEMLRVAT